MTYGDGIGLGLLVVVVADAVFVLSDCGSLEFWPDALFVALIGLALSMVFLLPGYLLLAGITTLILRRTHASPVVRRRWRLGPPLLLLLLATGYHFNRLRPTVGFRSATGAEAPASLRRFHYAYGHGLMWNRHVAWFEVAPADLKSFVQDKGLTLTNDVDLHRLLNSDRWISRTSVPNDVPQIPFTVCYVKLWQEQNFSTDRYLFTTPEHDRAVWVHRHDR